MGTQKNTYIADNCQFILDGGLKLMAVLSLFQVPLPVYLLGPNNHEQCVKYSDLGGYELFDDVVYLGSHGCFTTKEGLKIAYLSGKQQGLWTYLCHLYHQTIPTERLDNFNLALRLGNFISDD